jgi:hypothetical protein
MKCDEAFDRLTSPSGSDDAALERHLADCPRCRAMQETLSPAIAWLTIGDELFDGVGDYTGAPPLFLSEEAVRIAERTSRRLRPRSVPATEATGFVRRHERWLALAAVSLLAFFAAWLPPERPAEKTPAAFTPPQPAVANCLWWLPTGRDSLAQATADQVIASCTACHLATP